MSLIHTLHILNKSPEHPRSVACMAALRPGDALLLTENAVLALALQSEPVSSVSVYALAPDVVARGMGQSPSEASLVDFPAMVDLTARAKNIISW